MVGNLDVTGGTIGVRDLHARDRRDRGALPPANQDSFTPSRVLDLQPSGYYYCSRRFFLALLPGSGPEGTG
jgi:hypothetical protein